MGCVSSFLTQRKRYAYIHDSHEPLTESHFLPHDDFEFGSVIQTGGVGKVYRGVRKVDRRPVALKIFGYTSRVPEEAEVHREIRHMLALQDIPGCIELLGLFRDTAEGLVPGKLCITQFPVIVMELVDGGDMLQRVFENRMVSENILSQLFKGLVETLVRIHEKGFLHRDIKLENLLYCKYETYSTIKIIDLGMMAQLAPHETIYTSDGIQGTPGYLSPESILTHEYSAATDMWQAGCCLYTMLSAEPAFEDDNMNQITNGVFNEMKGFGWVGVSEEARDIVSRLLSREKGSRITGAEVLKHPWILDACTDINTDKEYYARIKAMSLRRSLRGVLKNKNLLVSNRKRRSELEQLLQPPQAAPSPGRRGSFSTHDSAKHKGLRPRTNSGGGGAGSTVSPRKYREPPSPKSLSIFVLPSFMSGESDGNQDSVFRREGFQSKIGKLKESFIAGMCPNFSTTGSLLFGGESWILDRDADVQFETFVKLAVDAELPELANISVFHVFDANQQTGCVSVVDMLLGLLAMRALPKLATPVPTPKNSKGQITIDAETLAAAQLCFYLFDIRSTGEIHLQELKFMLSFLVKDVLRNMSKDELAESEKRVEELFLTINVSKSGTIDFEEFKKFYHSIMLSTSKLRFKRASLQEVLRNRKSIITE